MEKERNVLNGKERSAQPCPLPTWGGGGGLAGREKQGVYPREVDSLLREVDSLLEKISIKKML